MVSVQAMRLVEGGRVEQAEEFEIEMQNLPPLVFLGLFAVYVLLLGLL